MVLIMLITLGIGASIATGVLGQQRIVKNTKESAQAYYTAEAGIEDAIYRLKNSMNIPASYTFAVGTSSVDVTVDSPTSNNRIVKAQGSRNNVFRKAEINLKLDITTVDFFYGMQIGEGGLKSLDKNVLIIGNVYSNGNIEGFPGPGGFTASGTVIIAGGTAPMADQEWTVQNDDFIFGTTVSSVNQYDAAQSFRTSIDEVLNKVTLYIRKVGTPSDITIQINKDKSGRPGEKGGDVLTSGTLFASQVTGSYEWVDIALSSAPTLDDAKTYWIVADATDDPNNYWEWGYDDNINAYPNGEGKYNTDNWNKKDDWNDIGGDLNFKIWLGGGAPTFIDQAIVGVDVWANTITNSKICGDAYYASISTIDVSSKSFLDSPSNPLCSNPLTPGTGFPNQPDTAPGTWPISDGNIADWKAEADAGTLISSSFVIPAGQTDTLGPARVTGNMELNDGSTLIMTGTIWVEGKIDVKKNAQVTLDPGYGSNSGVIISDGTMHFGDDANLAGTSDPDSFILFVVLAVGGGHHGLAIDFHKRSNVDAVIFVPNGGVRLHQDARVTQLTANYIEIDEDSVIEYDSGLTNINFSSGPGAGWQVTSWKEIE